MLVPVEAAVVVVADASTFSLVTPFVIAVVRLLPIPAL